MILWNSAVVDDSPEILTLNELMAVQTLVEGKWVERRISNLIKLGVLCGAWDTFHIAFITLSFSNSIGTYSTIGCSVDTGEKQAIVGSN